MFEIENWKPILKVTGVPVENPIYFTLFSYSNDIIEVYFERFRFPMKTISVEFYQDKLFYPL